MGFCGVAFWDLGVWGLGLRIWGFHYVSEPGGIVWGFGLLDSLGLRWVAVPLRSIGSCCWALNPCFRVSASSCFCLCFECHGVVVLPSFPSSMQCKSKLKFLFPSYSCPKVRFASPELRADGRLVKWAARLSPGSLPLDAAEGMCAFSLLRPGRSLCAAAFILGGVVGTRGNHSTSACQFNVFLHV